MSFTQEEVDFLESQQKEMNSAITDKHFMESQIQQQQIAQQEETTSMIKEQLDLSKEIITLKHILQGHILEEDDDGRVYWKKSDDPDLELLTPYGVNYLIQFVTAYSTKNTLLSNYDEETINHKMEDLSLTLADRIFMNYEKFFKYPTNKECMDILMERIRNKAEIRKFAYELAGLEINEEEIKIKLINEMEGRIEKEIEKIKEQAMKDKLKAFDSLLRMIQDFIHSSYNRAYAGQERKTLRQHIHISENRSPIMPTKKPSKLSLLNYGQ